MAKKNCQGCGAEIQSSNPQSYGYVPEHLLTQEPLLCQRCFRINHYGKDEIGPVLAQSSMVAIREGLAWSTGVVFIVDILDFDAGLPSEFIALLHNKNTLLAVNKVDLIPERTRLREVERWVLQRLKEYGLPKAKATLVSAVNGYGFPALADGLDALGKKVLFVGVTNVGKSSVLDRLLQMRVGGGQRSTVKPTISPYPGTTVSVSMWNCPGGLVLADSPGYVPEGRISDLVSRETAIKIIPHRRLSSHLYPVKAGDIIYIRGLAAVECLEAGQGGLLIGFTGSGAEWLKSSSKHLDKWLQVGQDDSEISLWGTMEIVLAPAQDLVFSGLGWLSARKAPLKLRAHIPAGVVPTVRPNLVGPKK